MRATGSPGASLNSRKMTVRMTKKISTISIDRFITYLRSSIIQDQAPCALLALSVPFRVFRGHFPLMGNSVKIVFRLSVALLVSFFVHRLGQSAGDLVADSR